MRFEGTREVSVAQDVVWASLHDPEVLRRLLTGCESITPLGGGTYAATMAARVGPLADTYRGTFSVEDLSPGDRLRVRMSARGRCGRLELELRVWLAQGSGPGATVLTYVADATVGGLVSRLAGAALRVAGNHVTGCFFQGLDRVAPARALAPA